MPRVVLVWSLALVAAGLPAQGPAPEVARASKSLDQAWQAWGAERAAKASIQAVAEALRILAAEPDPDGSQEVYVARCSAASLAEQIGDRKLAESTWRAALRFFARTRVHEQEPAWFPIYQGMRGNLARVLAQQQLPAKLDEALQLRDQIIADWKQHSDAPAAEVHLARFERAITLTLMAKFAEAQQEQQLVIDWFARERPGHPQLPRLWSGLASTLFHAGRYWEQPILELQQQAIDRYAEMDRELRQQLQRLDGKQDEASQQQRDDCRKQLEDTNGQWVVAMWEMAQIQRRRGDFIATRDFAQRSLDKARELHGEDHPSTVPPRGNLSAAYMDLGQVQKAESLYKENLRVLAAAGHPESSRDVVRVLSNLADCQRQLGDLGAAEATYRKTVRFNEQDPYTEPGSLGTNIGGLAVCLAKQGKCDEALQQLAKVPDYQDNPFRRGEVLAAKGTVYLAMGDAEQAAKELGEWVRTMQAGWGVADTSLMLRNHALALATAGNRRPELEQALRTMLDYSRKQMEQGVCLPPNEAYRYAVALAENGDLVLSLGKLTDKEPEFVAAAFGLLESLRGMPQRSAQLRAEASRDPAGADLVRRAQAARSVLAGMIAKPDGTPEQLTVEALARDQNEFNALFDYLQTHKIPVPQLTVADLGRRLPKDEAAVAYRLVQSWTVAAKTQPVAAEHLFAFVVAGAKGGALQWRDLGPAAPIDALVEQWLREIVPDNQRDAGRSTEEKKSVVPELRQKLLQPVLAMTGDAKVLYVCLDGTLHLIPLEELQEKRTVTFRFEDSLLRLLAADAGKPVAADASMVVLGGLDYDLEQELKQSGSEADDVAARFGKKFPKASKPVRLAQRAADRDSFFKALDGKRFVHLATHGYFVKGLRADDPDEAGIWATTLHGLAPMTQCGLVLSGDARVTAEELAARDLGQCELAVLSACGTYLGEGRRGHGLASLQAALHEAGARTVITSRWKVSDAFTARLMGRFYGHLWSGKTKAAALAEAKNDIRQVQGATMKDWAGWILTGDAR